MSSVLKPSTGSAGGIELPFASYAQIIRMLVPPAERISFYDAAGNALWINDGVEEPAFRMHVELVLSRSRQAASSAGTLAPAQSGDDTAFVFAIRNTSNVVVGAIGITCRDLPSGARFRSAEVVERMLAPVMTILGYAWPASAKVVPITSAPGREHGTRQASVAATQLSPSMPVPAMLRKTLSLATELIDCAFGAVVLPERPFTLSQCVSADESDLSVTAAIDNIREHVVRWMKTRNDTLVANSTAGKSQQLPYKLLVVPVRDPSQSVVALLMLFRSKHARDFAGVDVDELTQLAARVPTEALTAMLVPEVPVIASVVRLPQGAPPAVKAQPQPEAVKQQPAAPAPRPAASKPPVAPEAPAPVRERVVSSSANVTAPKAVIPSVPTPPPQKMDDRIRTALRLGSFDLYAQNIAPVRAPSQSSRFEVLLRMRDAGKLHGPPSFFAAAESSRLMPELDCWVIGELFKTLRKRAVTVRASSLEFSINIAGQSIATPQFGEFIVAEVCRTAIPAGLLVFEVSERTVLEHEDDMDYLSARLRDIGCRIALDNCRSGLGTLDPLNKWPVSRVKIDGSLIRNLGTSVRAESQVRAVTQLAADRGIETVAECVESQRVQDKLLEMGIDFAQGFHLAKPQPLQTLFR
jgi:EAL domain-containing protein (putative c-di-GMP-specific phosphodiesterase class I)